MRDSADGGEVADDSVRASTFIEAWTSATPVVLLDRAAGRKARVRCLALILTGDYYFVPHSVSSRSGMAVSSKSSDPRMDTVFFFISGFSADRQVQHASSDRNFFVVR